MKAPSSSHRVTRPGLVFLAALALVQPACTIPVLPLKPGTVHVDNGSHGLVFGRIRVFREERDQLATLGKTFGWWLRHEESNREYVVWLLTHDGPFVINLPAGHYHVTRIAYDEGAGLWEGSLGARFAVTAGEATYLGTWHIDMEFKGRAGRIYGRAEEELEAARANFLRTYVGSAKPIRVALLESDVEGFLSLVTLRVN